MKFSITRLCATSIAAMAPMVAMAIDAPIATVESDGAFEVTAAGPATAARAQTVRFTGSEYTFFSGDAVHSLADATVINLNSGGGLGLPKGARVSVSMTERGVAEVDLRAGALLYAFPDAGDQFVIRVGNFTLRGATPDVEVRQVARSDSPEPGAHVGVIERLADGNLRASVRRGALEVRNGEATRYQVSAGESVGLLDLPPSQLQTQNALEPAGQPLVLIQSPERVGTNENFEVLWEALEPADGDYLAIAKSGAEPDEFVTVISTDEGQILEFEAPARPGDYEIRFIDGETGAIERFVYLDVVEDIVAAYWWDDKIIGGVLGVAAGGVAVLIGSKIDGGGRPRPVSP